MRILFIGDVVGRAGRAAIAEHVPALRDRWKLDFVVVNGENAAGGFGITETICEDFLAAGADCVTSARRSSSSSASRALSGPQIIRRARRGAAPICLRRAAESACW